MLPNLDVIPAEAGTHAAASPRRWLHGRTFSMDSGLRRNDPVDLDMSLRFRASVIGSNLHPSH